MTNKSDQKYICESFGWSKDQFDKLVTSLYSFLALYGDNNEFDRVQFIKDYVVSETYKESGIDLETNTDYLLFGMAFQSAIYMSSQTISRDIVKLAMDARTDLLKHA